MTSLRQSIATLQRYPADEAVNISDVYKFLFMELPLSLNNMVDKIAALPESVPFHANIVTGVAMGGEVTVTLNRNGSYRFRGSMRASGAFSFSFRVGAVVQSASGQVAVAAQHTGKVFGTDTPGDRQNDWDEVITDPEKTSILRNLWPDISAGKMVVNRSSELSGVTGGAIDVVKDVIEILLVAETLGATLAICVVIGGELGNIGVDVPGLGGVVGLGIIGGSLFIWGPLAIGPAFILGVAAGTIIDSMIKIRRLHPFEEDFVKEVFGDSLDFDRIRLTNLVGIKDAPFTVPTVDNHILVNIGVSGTMFDHPTTTGIPDTAMATPGQLLIHELTHAWQILHSPLDRGFVPGWLCQGIFEQVIVGGSSYDYGDPGPAFSSFYNEAQAHIVDEWFAGTGLQAPDRLPKGLVPRDTPKMNPDSPYFGYIENDIRAAVR
jgi:hypothetical protein